MFSFDGNDIFCSNLGNATNITENSISPQNELHTAKLSFLVDVISLEIDKKYSICCL